MKDAKEGREAAGRRQGERLEVGGGGGAGRGAGADLEPGVRVVASLPRQQAAPMVFYVKFGMVMFLLIMGSELIRGVVAKGLTKVMISQRPTTDTEVQTDEIMDGGDPLHGHALHGRVWVSEAGERYHVVLNCRGLNGAIAGFIGGRDPYRICAITR